MRLENVGWDSRDPARHGRFWADALGARVLTDASDLVEVRLDLGQGEFLDLCFERVTEPPAIPQRLHVDLVGGADQSEVVERLVGLGARHVDIGQGAVPWVVLEDPDGIAFCVMEHRAEHVQGTGPIAALRLAGSDPERDGEFWSALTGWRPVEGISAVTLRHPTGVGPLLEFCPELEPRRGKSRLHLDVRPGPGDPDLVEVVRAGGGRVLDQPTGDLPWTVCADPSGNEVCILDRR